MPLWISRFQREIGAIAYGNMAVTLYPWPFFILLLD